MSTRVPEYMNPEASTAKTRLDRDHPPGHAYGGGRPGVITMVTMITMMMIRVTIRVTSMMTIMMTIKVTNLKTIMVTMMILNKKMPSFIPN